MLKRAGLEPTDAAKYELDHLVPLALGEHPRSKTTSGSSPGPEVERQGEGPAGTQAAAIVCAGQLSLQSARDAVQKGWKQAYRKFVGQTPKDLEDDAADTMVD